ncbi:MAG: TetR/AcrR family transcriptional regulator [Oscillospiraceae bacterium]|nr:TetR/AcrR family transcriptional regulator [Oscillospiraceae bacterium]
MAVKRQGGVSAAITEAFLQLMEEKPYMDITVSDVVNRAQVARVSFYRNFSSTSDILDRLADEAAADFSSHVLPVLPSRDERAWRAFLFRYIYYFGERQKRLSRCDPVNVNVLFSRVGDRLQAIEKGQNYKELRDKYLVSAKLGLINNVIRQWMDDGMQETPEQMVDYLMSVLMTI